MEVEGKILEGAWIVDQIASLEAALVQIKFSKAGTCQSCEATCTDALRIDRLQARQSISHTQGPWIRRVKDLDEDLHSLAALMRTGHLGKIRMPASMTAIGSSCHAS